MRFKLEEAYSKSMPKIIKDFIHNAPGVQRMLLDNGVDVATAEFKHYPKPTSNYDPIFKHDDTKVIFFTFPNTYPDYVRIKDINEDNNSFVKDPKGYYGARKAWRYVPAKQMIENGVDIYYVDKTETGENSRIPGVRATRRAYKQALNKDPNRRYTPQEIKAMGDSRYNYNTNEWENIEFDKSGYLKDPMKYVRKLMSSPNYRPDKGMMQKIQDLYDSILDTNAKIINSYGSIEGEEFKSVSGNATSQLRSALSNIDNAMNYYNAALNTMNDFTHYLDTNSTRNPSNISYYERRINDRINDANEYCKRAKSNMAKWLLAVVDWDTDDYVDDGL